MTKKFCAMTRQKKICSAIFWSDIKSATPHKSSSVYESFWFGTCSLFTYKSTWVILFYFWISEFSKMWKEQEKKSMPLRGFEPGPSSTKVKHSSNWAIRTMHESDFDFIHHILIKAKTRPEGQKSCKYPNSSRYGVKIIFSSNH